MITEIQLDDFKAHTDTRVPLERFTVLMGDNGVGKTSVLEAVHLLGQAFDLKKGLFGTVREHEQLFSGPRDLKWLTRSGANQPLRLRTTVASGKWAELVGAKAADLRDVRILWGQGDTTIEFASKLGYTQAPPDVTVARGSVVLRLEARALAEPSTSDEEQPRIEADGTGLATVLKELKATQLDRFQEFEAAARRVLPELEKVSFERVKRQRSSVRPVRVENETVSLSHTEDFIADGLLLQFKGTAPLPAHAASEGTLLTLGLLAFLHGQHTPKVVLLDDIERGLHPRARRELVTTIRAILREKKDVQVIATSHSPYLVDSFEPKEIVVLSRVEGKVLARRLADHPDKKLLASLTPGEFLTASGSDWFGL